eukprot:XP_001692783.1 predicted protein [Chlamydomonas reinhardtii]
MRRGRNKQGRAAHSSCINRSIENLDYFARLHERSQTSGARVTAFSQVLADAGALTPADWKAAEGSHGRLIVSLVGAHGWAARALELDYEREDAREVFTGTCDLTDTLVNLMPAEEHKLLALAIIRADSLSLHARLLARVAIEIKAGGGSNSSGGSSRSGSGGSVTGRGATSAAITATQRAAVNIHVQLLVLNVALRMLRMLLSYRDTRVELRAALLRTQLFEHMSVALLSLAATMATIPGAAAGDATEVLAPMGASWGLLLTCASTVGQCISSTVVLLDQTAQEEGHAFSPSFSLRCALAAGLLSRLEALLRNPQEEWPEAYATGGSSDHLLQLLLVDSGVWPLVLAHAPAVQVASLVATLTAAMRRLRHGHLSQAAAAEGRSSSRGGNASGSSSSGNGGGSSAAGTRPDTRAAVAGGNEAGAGTWWKGLVGLVERIVTFMEQSQRARFKLFCVEVTGGAPGTPGSQAQELASQQPQVPAQEQAQPQPQEQPPPQPPAQEQVPAPKTAAGVTAGGLCLRPSVYSPAAEQQRLLMSLCAWQWLPQVLFLARSYPLDNEGLWQYLQDMAAGQLSVAIVQALRAQQHAAGAAGGAGGADGADGKRDNSSSTTTTTTSSSSSLGTGCIPAAQAAESWRAFLYSQELDAEGFLAALLRHVGNPSCCIDSFWVAMLLAAIGAWDPGMLVRAAVAAAAADEGCGSSDGNGSSSISAAAVVSGARALVERAQREDNRWSRWPLPELFDFVAATVEQPSSAAGAGGVKTERLAAERPQPNGWRELQAVIMASFADVTALENLMSPAEVQARLHRLPVPVAAVVAGGTTAGSSTTGAAATAAATAEAGSGRGVVLCGNPACANTDGPSALFPAGGGKTCAR